MYKNKEGFGANPEEKEPNTGPEGKKIERGQDVVITNHWYRHAQKKSGDVFSKEGEQISTSSISEEGERKSQEVGAKVIAPESKAGVVKEYVSSSDRTRETADSLLKGYQEKKVDATKGETRERKQLTVDFPEEFMKLYDQKFGENKGKIMEKRGIPLENYSTLSSNLQESIAEEAEEPVIREWLDNPESDLAKLYLPRDAAADFAVLFHRRHERMAKRLDSGSKVDLVHVTHKTTTEPFLTSGVLINADGEKITKLDQLGGSLEILGGWESEIETDQNGQGEIVVRFREKEYKVDNEVLEKLASEGIDRSKSKRDNKVELKDN